MPAWVAMAGVVGAALAAAGCSGASVAGDDTGIAPLVGEWRGVLLSEGGELPFRVRVDTPGADPAGNAPAAVVLNGGGETAISFVDRQGAASYTLTFAAAEGAEIVARMAPSADALSGFWRYRQPDDTPIQMPFSATSGDRFRFRRNDPAVSPAAADGVEAVTTVNGEWQATPVDAAALDALVALVQEDETVVMTAGNAAGPMEGIYRNGLLRLSTFDGRRAVLLHARAQADGSLRGEVWVNGEASIGWEARR